MKKASNLCYLQSKQKKSASQQQQQQQQHVLNAHSNALVQDMIEEDIQIEDEFDTNVLAINFDFLKNAEKHMALGDATECQRCRAILNKYSNVEGDQIDKIWKCEFCGQNNTVQVEREEIPTQEDIIYIVESAVAQQHAHGGGGQNARAQATVFCLDLSGSMSATTELRGGDMANFKYGVSEDEWEMLRQFMDPREEQQLRAMARNGRTHAQGRSQPVQHVSRKQCLFAAVEEQIDQVLKASAARRRVGLVTFSDDVVVIGDGATPEALVIAGDKLQNFDAIVHDVDRRCDSLFTCPSVQESAAHLKKKLETLKERGKTALGPALLAALRTAVRASGGAPGAVVVLCTDGLANQGLGSLDAESEDAASVAFYARVAQMAQDAGVVVNVVTIKGGEGARLEVLGRLAESTQGSVTRVVPQDLAKDFAAALQDELVGTRVRVSVHLHRALRFRNEDEGVLVQGHGGSVCAKDVGNVTVATKMSFEYQAKTAEELAEIGIDVNALKAVPFQARILYTTAEGHRYLRVLTQMQRTTQDRREAEAQVESLPVIHQRIMQTSAAYAQQGRLEAAQQYNLAFTNYLNEKSSLNSTSSHQAANEEFSMKVSQRFDQTIQRKMMKNMTSSMKPQQQALHLSAEPTSETMLTGEMMQQRQRQNQNQKQQQQQRKPQAPPQQPKTAPKMVQSAHNYAAPAMHKRAHANPPIVQEQVIEEAEASGEFSQHNFFQKAQRSEQRKVEAVKYAMARKSGSPPPPQPAQKATQAQQHSKQANPGNAKLPPPVPAAAMAPPVASMTLARQAPPPQHTMLSTVVTKPAFNQLQKGFVAPHVEDVAVPENDEDDDEAMLYQFKQGRIE